MRAGGLVDAAVEPSIGRRGVLKAAAGLVATTILGPPGARAAGAAPNGSPSEPGIARERIDGRHKVTGGKIFARDYNARDLGWGAAQFYAMYLPALTTGHAFLGIDLSILPSAAKPARVVLGNDLSPSLRLPNLGAARRVFTRDLMLDVSTPAPSCTQPNFGLHSLIVSPGQVPSFLGQAVALLMFDSREAYLAARQAIQFQDADLQIYALDDQRSTDMDRPWCPTTVLVKYFRGGENFSYATIPAKIYRDELTAYRSKIAAFLAANTEFVTQPFAVDTKAMDPMFMEPESGLAYYDKASMRLSVLVGTQSPDGDVATIVSMYGEADAPFKVGEVVLHSCYPGGGFGGRDSSPFVQLLALTAAYSDGRPVKLMYNRFEQFRYGLKRPGAKIGGKLVAGSDMKLQAIEAQLTLNGGGTRNLSPYVAGLAALCIGGSYDIPAADIFAQSMHSQDITGGSQRGFGGPEAFLAIETALDDMAASQGWDPIAFRRANLATAGSHTVVGGPINQELRLSELLDRIEAHPLWADRANIKAAYRSRGLVYGTGLAVSMQAYGTSGDGMVAAVRMGAEGQLTVSSNAVDMGNGSATTLGVVVGPILGANAESVEMGNYKLWQETGLITNYVPDWQNPSWTAKAVGSSSACLTGLHQVHTLQQTALAFMLGSILPAARGIWGLMEVKPADVAWRDGRLGLVDGTRGPISRSELARAIYATGLPNGAVGHAYIRGDWVEADFDSPGGRLHLSLDGLSFYLPGIANPVFKPRFNTKPPPEAAQSYSRYVWAPCANVIGLTVDTRTGQVRIENVLSVLNAGRVLVPELVSGQSQGGVAMAIGYTLLEDMPDGMSGPANGSWNLHRYHVPRWQDVPLLAAYQPGRRAQELITLPETSQDSGMARGIAEAVMCSIAPAISNALRDAVQKRFTSLPITGAKILQGLQR